MEFSKHFKNKKKTIFIWFRSFHDLFLLLHREKHDSRLKFILLIWPNLQQPQGFLGLTSLLINLFNVPHHLWRKNILLWALSIVQWAYQHSADRAHCCRVIRAVRPKELETPKTKRNGGLFTIKITPKTVKESK